MSVYNLSMFLQTYFFSLFNCHEYSSNGFAVQDFLGRQNHDLTSYLKWDRPFSANRAKSAYEEVAKQEEWTVASLCTDETERTDTGADVAFAWILQLAANRKVQLRSVLFGQCF